MIQQNYLALFRNFIRSKKSLLRKHYLKMSGLAIKGGGNIGKISCKWPKCVEIGSECYIEDGVQFRIAHPFAGTNSISIGDRVFIGEYCQLNCVTKIIVGNDTKIAANTIIVDVSHEIGRHTTINKQPSFGQEIIIGNDVWIGAGAIILKGVVIGNGSVIGAGSLVNKSIPPYQVWAGSPARFIRHRE
jgi:acetyltransferase-like isoleucine patch superfamily enzyme